MAPSAWFVNIDRDPRLPKTPEWWVENIFKPFMATCQIFCFIPQLIGVKKKLPAMEQEAWKVVNPSGPVVPADRIMDFLSNESVKEVLDAV